MQSGGDEVSIEELASNLSTYKEQLLQVQQLLRDEPRNSEYVDMEKELVEVIALTEELLATAKQSEDGMDMGTSADASHGFHRSGNSNVESGSTLDHADKFPVGTKVQAVWSEDGEC